MSELVDACQELDQHLAQTIDVRIRPALVLQEIEVGSLKSWFKNQIEDIEDDDLRNLDWKRVVGSFLVSGKKRVIDSVSDSDSIDSVSQLATVEQDIRQLASATNVLPIPDYRTVSRPHLVRTYRRISASLELLEEEDAVAYISEEGRSPFNSQFRLNDDQAEQLVVTQSISNFAELILKV